MPENNLMTPSMLAKELNVGRATVSFWLNRFSRWLPYTWGDEEKKYHKDILQTLQFISEKINSGMATTDIEKFLDDANTNSSTKSELNNISSFIPTLKSLIQDTPNISPSSQPFLLSDNSIKLISSIVEKYYTHQERIAAAQERKAEAEEQKAEAEKLKAQALAKRAEAELQKASAINNLADAIKNISADFIHSLADKDIFSNFNTQSKSTFSSNQQSKDNSNEFKNDDNYLQDSSFDDLDSLVEDIKYKESEDNKNSEIDDLYSLIADDHYEEEIDDLFSLIEEDDNEIDDLSSLIEGNKEQIDDLYALIDYVQNDNLKPEILDSDVDDLMALIDDNNVGEAVSNNLLNSDNSNSDIMDDLSALIDEEPTYLSPDILDSDVDDLMALIDNEDEILIKPKSDKLLNNSLESNIIDNDDDSMDDLFALVEPDNESISPKIEKPKASLEENFEKYKAEVINIIIKLRKDGYSVEQTTELLNNEGIKPLSGKNRWTTKMISKIYKFIEAAEK